MHRAQQRWDALKAQDFKVAYTFMSPLQKATTPEAEYVRLMAGGTLGSMPAWLALPVRNKFAVPASVSGCITVTPQIWR